MQLRVFIKDNIVIISCNLYALKPERSFSLGNLGNDANSKYRDSNSPEDNAVHRIVHFYNPRSLAVTYILCRTLLSERVISMPHSPLKPLPYFPSFVPYSASTFCNFKAAFKSTGKTTHLNTGEKVVLNNSKLK